MSPRKSVNEYTCIPIVTKGEGINWKDTEQVNVCIKEVYDLIQNPPLDLQQKIERIRNLANRSLQKNPSESTLCMKNKIDTLKKELPSITISGTFPSGERRKENLIQHSGLLQIDVDKLSLEQVPLVK